MSIEVRAIAAIIDCELRAAYVRHIMLKLRIVALVGLWLSACGDSSRDEALPSAQQSNTGGVGASEQMTSGGVGAVQSPPTAGVQAIAGSSGGSGSGAPPVPMAGTSAGTSAGSGEPDAGPSTDAGAMIDSGGPPDPMWPIASDGWPVATPEDYGLDTTQLDVIADDLQRATGNTRFGLVIVKEGVLVYEKYWNGTDAGATHPVYSCTKSWGSTLIGIAVHEGLLAVDDPVTKWVPAPAREVGTGALVQHLLTQTAQTTPPGTSFAYNSGTIVNTLPEILEAASGMSSHAFYEMFLAEPLKLGMDWPPCPAGGCFGTRYGADYIQFGDQGPNGVLQSTIRDQAKLGWLWLNDGMWNGERLLDSEYIRAATEPSFGFQSIYGYLWWLNRDGPSSGPLGATLEYNPDVPSDMYHAVGGIGHCSVAVFPTQRLVIAHVGNLDGGGLDGHYGLFTSLFEP